MRIYQVTLVFKPEADNVERGQALVKEVFTKSGGTFLVETDMGERALAYAIKKADRGRYYHYEVEIDPEVIRDAKRTLQLAPEILKYLIVRKED